MLSFDRRYLLASLLALGACGFRPVYGPGGAGEGLQQAIRIAPPEDREAYELVRQLEKRLGQASAPGYELSYEITTTAKSAGITAAHEITRTQLVGSVEFSLTAIATGAEVQSGSVTSFTSFSNLGSTVSTASVERDAYRRLMVALADLLVTRLVATAPDWLG